MVNPIPIEQHAQILAAHTKEPSTVIVKRDGFDVECLMFRPNEKGDKNGYNTAVKINNNAYRVQRVHYMIKMGLTTLSGKGVHSNCGNMRCIEPTHLFQMGEDGYINTRKVNEGADNHNGTKGLSTTTRDMIRVDLTNGMKNKDVAALHNVTRSVVSGINKVLKDGGRDALNKNRQNVYAANQTLDNWTQSDFDRVQHMLDKGSVKGDYDEELKSHCQIFRRPKDGSVGYRQLSWNHITRCANTWVCILRDKTMNAYDKQGCHKCGVKDCVAPDHIYSGTAYENALDNRDAGKGNCKLTFEKAEEIREKRTHGVTVKALAKEYLVADRTIYSVLKGTTWRTRDNPGSPVEYTDAVNADATPVVAPAKRAHEEEPAPRPRKRRKGIK